MRAKRERDRERKKKNNKKKKKWYFSASAFSQDSVEDADADSPKKRHPSFLSTGSTSSTCRACGEVRCAPRRLGASRLCARCRPSDCPLELVFIVPTVRAFLFNHVIEHVRASGVVWFETLNWFNVRFLLVGTFHHQCSKDRHAATAISSPPACLHPSQPSRVVQFLFWLGPIYLQTERVYLESGKSMHSIRCGIQLGYTGLRF